VKAETKHKEKLPLRRRVVREIVGWLWVAAIFLLINAALGQARVIPSGSMEKTLLIGDHLIMSRLGYDAGIPFSKWHLSLWRDPRRHQIVIFRPPAAPDDPDLVKRVIGMPGDIVEIKDGAVWIGGQRQTEPYILEPMNPEQHFGPFHVPAKNYFVMGDNRNNSNDSRYFGFVPRSAIIGTPVLIYMSVDAPGDAWDTGDIRLRFLAYAHALINPRMVRWKRLFKAL
jgi:signal peptidase I